MALAWRSPALVREDAVLGAASAEGHRLALVVLAAMVASGAAVALAVSVEPHVALGPRARRTIAGALAAVALAGLAAGLVRAGGPVGVIEKAADSFAHSSAAVEADLNDRLFTLSANGRTEYWQVARDLVTAHPVLAPEALVAVRPDVVHVPNPLYRVEIGERLAALGVAAEVVLVDELPGAGAGVHAAASAAGSARSTSEATSPA